MSARVPSPAAVAVLFLTGSLTAFAQAPATLPPIRTATHDERGAFRVNDQPFFPIVLYDAPLDDATLRELRDFGFNVLACDAKSGASLREKGFYAACHGDARIDDLSGVVLGIGIDSPALNLRQDLLRQTAEHNAKTRAAFPGRPVMNAIGYWEDEPDGVIRGKLPSRAVYENLVAAIEVSAPYLYPVPHQPVASVGDAMARARAATAGRKPLLPILQLFAWSAGDRYPTPAELRCMAFLALAEGAHGVGYYSYGAVTGHPRKTIAAVQPDLWKSVRPLNRDLAEIGPRLLAGRNSSDLTLGDATPLVKMKVVRDEGRLLAIIVNASAMPQSAKLLGKSDALGRIERRNAAAVEINAGTASIRLEPFGVEILQAPNASE